MRDHSVRCSLNLSLRSRRKENQKCMSRCVRMGWTYLNTGNDESCCAKPNWWVAKEVSNFHCASGIVCIHQWYTFANAWYTARFWCIWIPIGGCIQSTAMELWWIGKQRRRKRTTDDYIGVRSFHNWIPDHEKGNIFKKNHQESVRSKLTNCWTTSQNLRFDCRSRHNWLTIRSTKRCTSCLFVNTNTPTTIWATSKRNRSTEYCTKFGWVRK